MKIARLRSRPNRSANSLPIIEVERDFLFASMMLAHIERLPRVAVLAKKSWAMSDSFEAFFEYQGQRFIMEIPFGCIRIIALNDNAPRESIDCLAAHIDNYKAVWPTQLLWAMARYFFLPFKPQPPHAA